MKIRYKYNSLEDFLISNPLSVDGILNDGWGANFPVKGKEIEATILFSDITAFSRKTSELTSTEILIFVNNFFAWVSAEALRNCSGIVDKYIGDEIMIIFSKEFGSEDCFKDALQTARWMAENDVLNFRPHIGIANGMVTVGFTGTPIKYNCSVFGNPVTLAARCASIKPSPESSSSIIFPAKLWNGDYFEEVFQPKKQKLSDGRIQEEPQDWKVYDARRESIKNMGEIEIIEIAKTSRWHPQKSAQDQAKESLSTLRNLGMYKPKTS